MPKTAPRVVPFSPFHGYRWRHGADRLPGTLMRLQPGQILVSTGDPLAEVYSVERGELEVSLVTPNGQTKIIHVAGEGSTFGELQLFGGLASCPVTVVARKPTLLRVTPFSTIQIAVARDPDLAANLMASMSRKALGFLRQIEDLTFRSVRQRVACLLEAMFSVADEGNVSLEIAQETIANLVGAHRVTVTISLQELQDKGIVAVARGRLFLLNPEELRREALQTTK
jgi:CRP-like cAMP-binding protein